ncbi:tetratricopeptide repeat protein [Candidatus Berkiella aquae]|uniref:Ancillary SecYEG translocon subunit n=1 Tax=Candidatus Berkiella aquae TaxID=295108 RepID=A0A0Q9YC70_9GAMM|nr:tetratricopeptide repeat protein [Candidatus Berkiella aquae]MCS5711046.1 tetratricopeptide repeat protein [Candidatus Berkiella aquae]
MEAYATEEQQLEAVKQWFKKHGNRLTWALIIVLGMIAGGRYWFHHQSVVANQASDNYALMISALEQNDQTTLKSKAELLIKDYPQSPYASLAALVVAHQAVKEGDFKNAQEGYKWVLDYSKQADFQALARARLMRLLIAENKADEALALFDEQKARAFLPLMAEMKGDILLKKNDVKGAVSAYQLALKSAKEEGMVGPLLKVKLEDLGISVEDKKAEKS